ncbi:MAG TPA: cupredoxin domain-containing protein [Acidimicrobiia bacterium]|nr:cupredoxin domain-containing protein [Acidimicrobiia bacterium]
MRRVTALVIPVVLIVAACGDDDATTTTTPTTIAPTTTVSAAPAMSPAEVVFEDQASDGATIVVASVTLPSPGFIAVHGNADGAPGPVIGYSDLLPAGTSTDVGITLDDPLEATDLVFPMAHIDVDGDGVYEFFPPEETVDGPALTADGDVAVVGGEVTVDGDASDASGAVITIAGFDYSGASVVSVGETVTVRNDDGVSHTLTADDVSFDSGTIGGGEEVTLTFDEPGEYSYFCKFHPSMTGTITVEG